MTPHASVPATPRIAAAPCKVGCGLRPAASAVVGSCMAATDASDVRQRAIRVRSHVWDRRMACLAITGSSVHLSECLRYPHPSECLFECRPRGSLRARQRQSAAASSTGFSSVEDRGADRCSAGASQSSRGESVCAMMPLPPADYQADHAQRCRRGNPAATVPARCRSRSRPQPRTGTCRWGLTHPTPHQVRQTTESVCDTWHAVRTVDQNLRVGLPDRKDQQETHMIQATS